MYQSQDQNGTTPYGPPTARVLLHNIRHGQGGRLVTLAAAAALLSLTLAAAALVPVLLSSARISPGPAERPGSSPEQC
jgi:hypothetical protein